MNPEVRDEILQLMEIARTAGAARPIDIAKECFTKQYDFISDSRPFITALCSRRAGKSVGCVFDLLETARATPGVICLYITLSRANAARIIWPVLKETNTRYNLGGIPNETTLSIKIPNGSIVYCCGAKDTRAIENLLGLPIKKVYIDECQSFPAYLEDLVDRVLAPALMDYAGVLRLIGTPPPVPVGYFIKMCQSPEWGHHQWTFFDNPWIAKKSGMTHQALLERELKRRGIAMNHPSIQRDYFGMLTTDTESLVWEYSAARNHYDGLPNELSTHILGIDIGYEDADALAVLGHSATDKATYLVEESITPKQGITELVNQIEYFRKKYHFHKVVMDFGGLGKKIAEEIIRRYHVHVQPAEKSRKLEYIELLNDAMRTSQFKAKKDSKFAQDCMLVEWDHDKSTPDRRVVSDRYHSDICDAVLYAWRESYSFTSQPQKVAPKIHTPEWFREEAERMEAAAEEHFAEEERMTRAFQNDLL